MVVVELLVDEGDATFPGLCNEDAGAVMEGVLVARTAVDEDPLELAEIGRVRIEHVDGIPPFPPLQGQVRDYFGVMTTSTRFSAAGFDLGTERVGSEDSTALPLSRHSCSFCERRNCWRATPATLSRIRS